MSQPEGADVSIRWLIFKKCNKVQDMCVEDGDASSRGRRVAENGCDAGGCRAGTRCGGEQVVACCKVSLILATTRNFKFKGGRRTKAFPPWPRRRTLMSALPLHGTSCSKIFIARYRARLSYVRQTVKERKLQGYVGMIAHSSFLSIPPYTCI